MEQYNSETNSLVLDTSSFESGINSPVLSPVVDDNIVLDLLVVNENQGDEPTLQRRTSIKEFFRSLTWHGKKKRADTKESKSKLSPEEEASVSDGSSKQKESMESENVTKALSVGLFDDLYDNSVTIDLTQYKDQPYEDQENINEPRTSKNNEIKTKDLNTVSNDIDSFDIDSSKKTLSRRFSIFSHRSKSKFKSKKRKEGEFDTVKAVEHLKEFNMFEKDKTNDLNQKQPKLIFDSMPDNVINDSNNIYLFLNKDYKEQEQEANNVENFILFPQSSLENDRHTTTRNWEDKTELNRTILKSKDFNTPGNQSKSLPNMDIYNDAFINKESLLTISSMNIPEVLKFHRDRENLKKRDTTEQLNFKSYRRLLNNQMDLLNVSRLQEIQCPQKNFKIQTLWKIWVCQPRKLNHHRKYKVAEKLLDYEIFSERRIEYQNLLVQEVLEKDERVYILKNGESPLIYQNEHFKSVGEYVFTIPLGENHLKVWNSVLSLLVEGKFDRNTANRAITGICWRRYRYKEAVGFHLTFYVDDRVGFEENQVLLLLSDIRLLIPEGEKQYFKRCKTMYPGSANAVELVVA